MSLTPDRTSKLDEESLPFPASSSQGPRETSAICETHCDHCGLTVAPALLRPQESTQFCCAGCETVYHLLQGAGLEEYYGFRQRLGEGGRKVEIAHLSDAREFDTLSFQELYCERTPSELCRTQLLLEGVHCAACVWLVEKLPNLEPSVASARLEMGRALVTIEWDDSQTKLSTLAETLTKMGYRPRPFRGKEAAQMRRDEDRGLLLRIGVSGASAGNVMLMAFALYSGSIGFNEASTMDFATRRFFEIASLIVSLPALWAGGIFFRGAWASFKTRSPHMDLPIALGILTAFLWGSYNALTGSGEIYFDSATALIFLLLIGRYVGRKQRHSTNDAAELFHSVVPAHARVLTQPSFEASQSTVGTQEISPGAYVLVQSGEIVPVDGMIAQGISALDNSRFSGESRPVTVAPGSPIEAGSLNLGSSLIIQVVESGKETRVAQLMTQVEQALSARTPLVAQADRIAGTFTLIIIALALMVGIYWSFESSSVAIERALSLLIVACPCALGLATPLALSSAVSQAARARVLVFAPDSLEKLATPATIVLDKTGTLTEGKLSVESWLGDRELGRAVLLAEKQSTHPVARTLVSYLESVEMKDSGVQIGRVVEHLGGGLTTTWGNGELAIGSPRFVLGRATMSGALKEAFEKLPTSTSPVLVALDGQVRSLFSVSDTIREDAAASLLHLRKWGYKLHLLSGDYLPTVQAVAQKISTLSGDPDLFSSIEGASSPEAKLAFVAELKQANSTIVMVGDGVNDAGALARADVGIAVKGAAEASQMSADIYLANAGVHELVTLFGGARKVQNTVRRGILFSLAYNVLGVSAAALGLLSPLAAAILMPLSSLTVVSNAYRSRVFPPKQASSLGGDS